ncbi:alpha/beta fold hydrolase [Vibrio nigripulchritudo]|uniref:alpha/beta fold hydrolase n=1 Tax=Vibrio nigripulchritudo TaxID=28173 RepID=UPI0024936906|nr:alpha/beta fold hydrolase [Vibrio nigripulchritudo]BDU39314.1 alpha/beta hydrolase [Vibrio nigripulchritudo]BDU45034.1 alpha/beta hydrolase [Vibrio nigripulchritudo]
MNTPLVLLPGMMCDERLFDAQVAEFSSERQVIVLPVTQAYSMQELAEKVLEKAPSTFALAGLSMGGIVAMEVFRQQPKRIERLALLDTNPRAELDEVKQGRARQLDRVAKGEMLNVMSEEMIPRYCHRDFPNPSIDKLCLDMANGLGDEVFVRQSLALRERPDQQQTLATVTQPTLILAGEDDQLCPLDRHECMKALIPHATLTLIPKAGHLTTLEQPEATNAALRAWLES